MTSNKHNLSKVKHSPKLSPSHIEWSPLEDNKFAIASISGHVSIFDMDHWNRSFSRKPIIHLKQHTNAVNKVCWNPFNQKMIVSAGHDGFVKIWDQNSQHSIDSIQQAQSFREVKFHPLLPNYLITGNDSGALEMYDIRQMKKALISKKCAHGKSILTIDWNPKFKNLLASGSLDKEIKIWEVNPQQSEIQDILKIRNQSGVQCVKWKNTQPHILGASSFNQDSSISFFDILQPHHPHSVVKGHKENVTSFLFSPDEQLIFSGSKDNYLICQNINDAYKPFHMSSKVSQTISNTNVFAFISEFGENKEQSFSSGEVLIEQIKKQTVQQKTKHIHLFNLDEICASFEENNVFNSFQEELKYYCENYMTKGKIEDIVAHNQKVAMETKRADIGRLWGDFFRVLSFKEEEEEVEKSIIQEREQREVVSVVSQRDQLEMNSQPGERMSMLDSGQANDINQQKLFQYFEKNPILLKQEVEEKNIIYRNNCIYFMKTKMVKYQQLIKKMLNEDQKDLQQDQDNQRDIIKQSLVDALQEVIDRGQLQHAFTIYRVFQENGYYLNVDPQQLQLWSMAYIELLRNNRFYIQANQSIKFSGLDIIRNTNKKNTSIYFQVTCHKCMKCVDLDSQYQCTICKTQALCGICQEPLNRGLLVWCQQCSHATHARETKQWFQNNTDCPTGCGHKCFNVTSL